MDLRTYQTMIRAILKTLRDEMQPINYRLNQQDPYLLEKPIDKVAASNSGKIAVIDRVVVDHSGNFTCPVETFMIFTSTEYVPVDHPEF